MGRFAFLALTLSADADFVYLIDKHILGGLWADSHFWHSRCGQMQIYSYICVFIYIVTNRYVFVYVTVFLVQMPNGYF